MPLNHRSRNLIDLAQLEDSVRLYSTRLRKLQRFWIPLQKQAPRLVMVLWVLGVTASLFTQSYAHWMFTAPAICLLIVLEIVIEEMQIDLLLMSEEARYLLDITRGLYTDSFRPPTALHTGASCPPPHRNA